MKSSSVDAVYSGQLSKKDLTISDEFFGTIQEKK